MQSPFVVHLFAVTLTEATVFSTVPATADDVLVYMGDVSLGDSTDVTRMSH